MADGRLLYELKHRWRDGTTHVGFDPLELLEKLAALIPPPRFNLVRYHGVLAPAARHRARIVSSSGRSGESVPSGTGIPPSESEGSGVENPAVAVRPRNYSWAELMRRVFEVDVLMCPSCHGRMRVLAAILAPEAIRSILKCFGLPARAPPVSPADRNEPAACASEI